MIVALNSLLDLVEDHLTEDEIDVTSLARTHGTTEFHLRRMFTSLFNMSLAEYTRRRRMTVALADVLGRDRIIDIAVRHGYASTEAFGRAFRSVHGTSVADVRAHGGPLRTQPKLRLRITIEGNTAMDARILNLPEVTLVGHSAEVPLIHEGANPHIQAHLATIPMAEHLRLKEMSSAEPRGLLAVTAGVDPDAEEGSLVTYLHGVAIAAGTTPAEDLDVISVPEGTWVAFRSSGPYPQTLQDTWARTATDWFPSNMWRLRPGPSIVSIVDRADDFSTATTELWMPVEAGSRLSN